MVLERQGESGKIFRIRGVGIDVPFFVIFNITGDLVSAGDHIPKKVG
jgi:hypothetical protein